MQIRFGVHVPVQFDPEKHEPSTRAVDVSKRGKKAVVCYLGLGKGFLEVELALDHLVGLGVVVAR